MKQQIQELFDKIAESLFHWNDVARDEDRGRSNDAIALVLWDDGSGKLGKWYADDDQGNPLYHTWVEFKDSEQLADFLVEWMD